MEYLKAHLLKTPAQRGLAIIGVGLASLLFLRSSLKKKKQLSGKVVVITGASSGIGEALAHEFVRNGCKVILAARSMDKLANLKEMLVERYQVAADSVSPIFIDLSDHASVPKVCQSMIAIYGRVDILVNNAGIYCDSSIVDAELDTFKRIMDVNLFGQIAVTKGMLPHMIKQEGGTVVAVSSILGRIATINSSVYSTAKHALQAFCDSLRNENRKHNIDVLVVSPSYVTTPNPQRTISGSGEMISGDLLRERTELMNSGMPAEHCASAIMEALRNYETDYLIGPFPDRMIVYVRAVFPSVYNRLMSRF